ncbi:EAL domain-containing protein [Comamonas sp.]|uniref:EAL domain-containing protein n=1 Tax=Comamonas sp. TaxID=34028 RepID=UPI003A9212FC
MVKRRTKIMVMACVGAWLAFSLPVGASIYLAWVQGHKETNGFLALATRGVLNRSAVLRFQANAAIDQLVAEDYEVACSEADLERMRAVAAVSSYLQGVGRIRVNLLECSTLGGSEAIDIGAPDRNYPLPGMPRFWDAIKLPQNPAPMFSVFSRAGYAVIYLPELVSDVTVSPGMAVGQFSVSDQKIIQSMGEVDEAWIQQFKNVETFFEDDQGRRVSIKPSDLGTTAAFAAMPREQVRSYVDGAAARMIPVGVIIGALLALVVLLRARYQLSFKARLREALRRKEFHMVYQPVMDLRTNRCVGAEALIRWSPPDEQPVSPAVFIPEAESHGLIKQVTAQVMEMVARDSVALITAYPHTHIAINFSAEDLHSPQMEGQLATLLQHAGAQSRNILIEATERGLMQPDKAKGRLVSVRAQGFKVAIDDFGTGSSSLSYLATYDLDLLKIDKMFVDSFEQNSSTSKVALHIIEIARTLGLEMIAEGVETERQRDTLRAAGVQYAQGWLFARPMPMGDLMGFMRASNDVAAVAPVAPETI